VWYVTTTLLRFQQADLTIHLTSRRVWNVGTMWHADGHHTAREQAIKKHLGPNLSVCVWADDGVAAALRDLYNGEPSTTLTNLHRSSRPRFKQTRHMTWKACGMRPSVPQANMKAQIPPAWLTSATALALGHASTHRTQAADLCKYMLCFTSPSARDG
jgi:hypothetical protein